MEAPPASLLRVGVARFSRADVGSVIRLRQADGSWRAAQIVTVHDACSVSLRPLTSFESAVFAILFAVRRLWRALRGRLWIVGAVVLVPLTVSALAASGGWERFIAGAAIAAAASTYLVLDRRQR